MGWVLLLALAQPSCGEVERDAIASEAIAVSREPGAIGASCELGALASVAACGGNAACHVCARLELESAVCVQPCSLGGADCPSGQSCRPIGALRDAGGYARIGDCPAGYCS